MSVIYEQLKCSLSLNDKSQKHTVFLRKGMGQKPNILAGSVSSGFDAPRVADNCPNPPRFARQRSGQLPATLGASNPELTSLQVCLL